MANGVLIKVDKDTLSRFRELANDTPVAQYLRELSKQLSGDNPPSFSPLEKKLDEILENQKRLLERFSMFKLKYENKYGQMVDAPDIIDHGPSAIELIRAAGIKPSTTLEEEEANLPRILEIFKSIKRGGTQMDAVELAKYDEEHPDGEADCGFYHRDAKGKWRIVPERVEKADHEDALDVDRLGNKESFAAWHPELKNKNRKRSGDDK